MGEIHIPLTDTEREQLRRGVADAKLKLLAELNRAKPDEQRSRDGYGVEDGAKK